MVKEKGLLDLADASTRMEAAGYEHFCFARARTVEAKVNATLEDETEHR
jgi:hypothetical protein